MTDDAPPPTAESLRVDPAAFDAMIDRSAGGPAYRRLIRILKGLLGFVAVAAVVGVTVTLLALGQVAEVLHRLDEGADKADVQRELLIEQNRLAVAQGQVLVECTTPSPAPGAPRAPEDDGVHECYERGQSRGLELVGLITRTQVAIAECVRARAPDLTACATDRLDPAGPLGPSPAPGAPVARAG